MKRFALCGLVGFLVGAWLAAASAEPLTRVVDFDRSVDGTAIRSGDGVGSQYQWWHVTFQRVWRGSCWSSASANGNCIDRSPISAPNWASLRDTWSCPDISENRDGLIRATLDVPCSMVSIVIDPTGESSQGVLRAYDEGGALIGEALSPPGVVGTISVTGVGIRRAEFSGWGSSLVRCDDFTFTYDTTPVDRATWGTIKAVYR